MGETLQSWPSLVAGQAALLAAVAFLLSGLFSWWLYRRELLFSHQRRQAEERARLLVARLLSSDELQQLRRWTFL